MDNDYQKTITLPREDFEKIVRSFNTLVLWAPVVLPANDETTTYGRGYHRARQGAQEALKIAEQYDAGVAGGVGV